MITKNIKKTAARISKTTKYEIRGGKLFDSAEEAQEHLNKKDFLQEINDKFSVYDRIEDIDEFVEWLESEGLLAENALNLRYNKEVS